MYAFLSHKVRDYATWRPYYDTDEPRRAAHGIKTLRVFTEQGDPNNVFIYWEVQDPMEVKKMAQDPQLQEVIKKAGVIGIPEIHFYEEK